MFMGLDKIYWEKFWKCLYCSGQYNNCSSYIFPNNYAIQKTSELCFKNETNCIQLHFTYFQWNYCFLFSYTVKLSPSSKNWVQILFLRSQLVAKVSYMYDIFILSLTNWGWARCISSFFSSEMLPILHSLCPLVYCQLQKAVMSAYLTLQKNKVMFFFFWLGIYAILMHL